MVFLTLTNTIFHACRVNPEVRDSIKRVKYLFFASIFFALSGVILFGISRASDSENDFLFNASFVVIEFSFAIVAGAMDNIRSHFSWTLRFHRWTTNLEHRGVVLEQELEDELAKIRADYRKLYQISPAIAREVSQEIRSLVEPDSKISSEEGTDHHVN